MGTISISEILMFITGVRVMPPLGLPSKIAVAFKHNCGIECKCRPYVSTCAIGIPIPIHGKNDVGELMSLAVQEYGGFGRA